MGARDDLLRLWREGTDDDRRRLVYLMKLARLRETQQRLDEEMRKHVPDDSN